MPVWSRTATQSKYDLLKLGTYSLLIQTESRIQQVRLFGVFIVYNKHNKSVNSMRARQSKRVVCGFVATDMSLILQMIFCLQKAVSSVRGDRSAIIHLQGRSHIQAV